MYEDLQANLDRALLNRQEPPSHALAKQQFAQAGIAYKEIVRADPDAILFVADDDVPWTAWSEASADGKRVVFYREKGFPAFPSAYLKDSK